MVGAFLQLDQRLSIITDGVEAAAALGMSGDLVRAFVPLRDACYETINEYLALSGQEARATPLGDVQRTMNRITDSIRSLDQFYERNSTQIEHARISYAAVPDEAARARAESDQLLERLGGLPADQLAYSSVKNALDQHDQARLQLEAAQLDVSGGGGDRAGLRSKAAALTAAVKKLRQAVDQAPSRAGEATAALASVRTRLSAVRNRSARMPETYSALLREFSAECSKDLVGHDRRSARDLEVAASEIDGAAAQVTQDPEAALAAITRARSVLANAEQLVDGVTDRLNELRAVQQDPPAAAGRIRFQIRDAQLLAVNLGLVKQWGSVLDAQVLRVDRAVATLTGRHPDYWGYLVDLRAISDFVTGVVSKMKDEARRS
jgi:chromosome segregation ATPase